MTLGRRTAAAAAFTVFHPPHRQQFDGWLGELREAAKAARGFVDLAVSIPTDTRIDWAIMITFTTDDLLDAWLDGDAWQTAVRDGATRGIRRLSTDLVVGDGGAKPTGVAAFRHSVGDGKDAEFLAAQSGLTAASAAFPGYEGTAVFTPGASGEWTSLIRFRTEKQLADWMSSPQRAEALPELRSTLTKDFSVVSHTTPLGTTVRTVDGKTRMTPSWKTAMLLLMVLYPTVMLLSRFLGPVLKGWGTAPWFALWLSQVVSVSALQWWLMPAASSAFRRWLDPVEGASPRISAVGAAAVVAIYAATLLLFATVTWLHY